MEILQDITLRLFQKMSKCPSEIFGGIHPGIPTVILPKMLTRISPNIPDGVPPGISSENCGWILSGIPA